MFDQSGIYMLEEKIDKYSLLYLRFVFSYCFDVVLAYNTLIYHIFNDNAHETCMDAEPYHQLTHAIIYLEAHSFVCQPENKDGKINERKYAGINLVVFFY